MADVSGMVQGLHLGAQDAQARQLSNIAMAEAPVRLEKQKIEVQQAKTALEAQQRMLKMMAGMGSNGQVDPSTAANSMAGSMDQLAQMALSSGLPEQAKEYASTASTIRKNQSTIAENQSRQIIRNSDIASRLLSNVSDQQSFDQAQMLFTTITGQPSPYLGKRFTPQLRQQILDLAQSAKDKALTQRAEAQTLAAEARTDEMKARIPLIRAQTRESQAREAKLRKEGDVNRPPKAADIQAVTDRMEREYDIAPEDKANARAIARPIAERVKELMKENPELRQTAAVNRAFQEAKNRGDFGGLPVLRGQPGGSAARALALPKDQTKLKENQWYLVQGEPRLLMEGAFYTPEELAATGEEEENPEDLEPAEEEEE